MPIKVSTIRLFLFFIIAFCISGCQTLSSPARSDEPWPSASWEVQKSLSDSTWTNLRNQKIDNEQPLNLNGLIDIALRKAPSLRQYWRQARAHQAALQQAQSKLYPQLSLDTKITRSKSEGSTSSSDKDELKYGPSADITYLLFDFGGRQALIEGATEDLISANYAFNQSIQDLLLAVEQAYYDLNSAKSSLMAAQSNVEDTQKTYEVSQVRFEAGLGVKLDVLQAKSDLDNALYGQEEAKSDLKTAEANLAVALGLPADYRLEITPPSKKIPADLDEVDMTSLINEALALRPDISAQKAALRSKQAALRAANAALLPSVSLGASGERNWYEDYENNRNRSHDYDMGASVSLDWNIFDGFYNLSAKQRAEELAKLEEENLIEAELQASANVWISFFNYKTAFKKLNYSQSFLESAKNSHELALESYKCGLGDILDVLGTQAKVAQARTQLIASEEDLYMALANLSHATGRLCRENIVNLEQETVSLNITEY
jgi:TolC family type I secretion outer membrane protein